MKSALDRIASGRLVLGLSIVAATIQSAQTPPPRASGNRPVATHGMAIVFGYVPEADIDQAGVKDIESVIFNPANNALECSGVIERLADLFYQNKFYILTNTSLLRAMIRRYPNVPVERWKARRASDFVYFFIPEGQMFSDTVNWFAHIDGMLQIEPYMGIKLGRTDPTSPEQLRSPGYSKLPASSLTDSSRKILSTIWNGQKSDVFFTNSDYSLDAYRDLKPKPQPPRWAIYMLGFGQQSSGIEAQDGIICGLTVPYFKQLIDFFATHLNIGVLIVACSYFADINLIATLGGSAGSGLRTLPFPLILAEITAAPLLSGPNVGEHRPFNAVFGTLAPPPTIDMRRVNWQLTPESFGPLIGQISYPYRYVVGGQERHTTPAAIPILRPANNQLFVTAPLEHRVVRLTDNLIKPGLEKQPLYLKELLPRAPGGIELLVPDIIMLNFRKEFTRPLVLAPRADRKLPTMMGIDPGPFAYSFDEIDSQGAGISSVIDAFLRIPGLEQDRAFMVKKLHASNDIDKLVAVNRAKAEQTFFELKCVHLRSKSPGSPSKNMVTIRQFDCTRHCPPRRQLQKQPVAGRPIPPQTPQGREATPDFSVVAITDATWQDGTKPRWLPVGPRGKTDPIDEIIADIKKRTLPPTLNIFAP
ncbi:MAG: hypothetical protein M1549_01440 [Candidatus Dependentiae bacterium]|nr:hypothetical protein [Candidatus Dependentiae bacterium]